jgi:hypothetical protein
MGVITPNMVNDGHDTNVGFQGDFLKLLVPLLKVERFNGPDTLMILIADENENAKSTMESLLSFSVMLSRNTLHGSNDSIFYLIALYREEQLGTQGVWTQRRQQVRVLLKFMLSHFRHILIDLDLQ